jgi:hypothetical protein
MCVICEGKYTENTRSINCMGCQRVKSIPCLPQLRELYIAYTRITELPLFETLTILHCSHSSLRSIPLFKNLTELYCCDTKINEIPYIESLLVLSCINTNIQTLLKYPKLMRLNCNNCRMLTHVHYDKYDIARLSNRNSIFEHCPWLYPNVKDIEKVKMIQRFYKRFLNIKRFKIRMVLNKYIYPDLINIITKYL